MKHLATSIGRVQLEVNDQTWGHKPSRDAALLCHGWGSPFSPFPLSPTKPISTAKDPKIAPNKRCSSARHRQSGAVTPIYL